MGYSIDVVFLVFTLLVSLCRSTALDDTVGRISCQFEHGLCGWSQNETTEFKWMMTNGTTPDVTSGPSRDHTFENSTSIFGHYMYTNGWISYKTASLISSNFSINKPLIFSFWYFMNGNRIGNLTLYLIHNNSNEAVLWKKSGRQGDTWKYASVSLNGIFKNGYFNLKFVSSTVSPTGSDLALDDFRLSSADDLPVAVDTTPTIPPTTLQQTTSHATVRNGSCNFDKDMCGYTTHGVNNKLIWERHSGTTGFLGIPVKNSSYVYFNSYADILSDNGTSELISPTLNVDHCITLMFDYVMPYFKPMILSVKTLYNGSYSSIKYFRKWGMRRWEKIQINSICPVTAFKLVFLTSKLDAHSFVGVDNIQFVKGFKDQSKHCSFDKDLCGFTNMTDAPVFWQIGSLDNGPTADHTTGLSSGRYLYISFTKSTAPKESPFAKILSEQINGTIYKCFLLRFIITTTNTGSFNIFIVKQSHRISKYPSWTLGMQPVNKWSQLELNLPAEDGIQLELEGNTNVKETGYLAIDDMMLITSTCKETPKCQPDTCLHNGKCVESFGANVVCYCMSGFTGYKCQTASSKPTTLKPTTPKPRTPKPTTPKPTTPKPTPKQTTPKPTPKPPHKSTTTYMPTTPKTVTPKPTTTPKPTHTPTTTPKPTPKPTLTHTPTTPKPATTHRPTTPTRTMPPKTTTPTPTPKSTSTTPKPPTPTIARINTITTTPSPKIPASMSSTPLPVTTISSTSTPFITQTNSTESATVTNGAALTKSETYALIATGTLAAVIILSCVVFRCVKKRRRLPRGDIVEDSSGSELNKLEVSKDVKDPRDDAIRLVTKL